MQRVMRPIFWVIAKVPDLMRKMAKTSENPRARVSKLFSEKHQIMNISGLVSHTVSVATTELFFKISHSAKAAVDINEWNDTAVFQ